MALTTTGAITMTMIRISNRMALIAKMAIPMTMITFHCYSNHIAIRRTKIRIAMQWHLYAWHTQIARAVAQWH